MKSTPLFILILFSAVAFSQVGIGTTTPNASAALDITSTTTGVLVPRMTEAQRTAISSPATGLLVYQIDNTAGFWFFDGSNWTSLSSGAEKINDLIDGKSDNDGSSIFLGIEAGENEDQNDNQNIGIGYQALSQTRNGSRNVAIGYQTLFQGINGDDNIVIGNGALKENKSDSNIAIGSNALTRLGSGIGNNIAIGTNALSSASSASKSIAIGTGSLENFGNPTDVIAIGYNSLHNNTFADNMAIGSYSQESNTTGVNNLSVGGSSLRMSVSEGWNTAIGMGSMELSTGSSSNTAVGYQSLRNITHSLGATAVGYKALAENTTGSSNTAIGNNALGQNTTGRYNSALGYSSLQNNTTGDNNIAIGLGALLQNTSGDYNTAVGRSSCSIITDGSRNTAIGYNSGPNANLSNTITIGYNAVSDANNIARVGDASITSIGGYANWSNLSDGRFKKNIHENVVGLDFILKLRPVTYNLDMDAIARFNNASENPWLSDAETQKASEVQIGFIAQEVEKTAQEISFDFHGVDKPKNETSHYGLRYAEFVVPLVKAVQEQQEVIELQKRKIDQLENRLITIEALLTRLNK
ncbi:tail fiber domain-containing protein [Altibacter lentus]|uniref:tail fiber domain-containing protein n=2 Tax=Altibacter lentus TaxID=1223410 RepID=UPI00054F96B2|nr:tail fiber domain-containing protein [Altibacter lentus]